ncbi:peptidyl-prolyl cis-trans isomerase FKBP2-like [Mytilus galloprovincialis]|uniref:peptidyl-prolyl cis-trans isomerase FKBP2-like n=1 Tax=Mytilus galloprovincialis TaxID=29158 RepID=UPI003F7BDB67
MFKQVRKFVFICIVCFVVCSAASKANGNSKNKSKRKEMKIETLKKVECADDKSAQLGSVVHFHYKLSVEGHPDIIESTYEDGNNAQDKGVVHMLTKGVTLKGLVKGIPGMCVGEIRRLTIPPHMAFGSKGNDRFPPGATVIYEIELLDAKPADEVLQRFTRADLNEDGVLDVTELEAVMSIAMKDGNFPMADDPAIMEGMLNELFQFADKNKDGGISTDEFRTMLKLQNNLGGKRTKSKQEL